MNLALLGGMVGACVLLMILESRGLRTTLALHFKGDIKRESRWFAQYGQFACTAVAAVLVWRLDPRPYVKSGAMGMVLTVMAVSLVAMFLKRLVSRVRPGREHAGTFLGPQFSHANFRESFPSSHSACAVALTVVLGVLYPDGAAIFWTLAILCGTLRYLLDAHWPSDVLGGMALGYAMAYGGVRLFQIHP